MAFSILSLGAFRLIFAWWSSSWYETFFPVLSMSMKSFIMASWRPVIRSFVFPLSVIFCVVSIMSVVSRVIRSNLSVLSERVCASMFVVACFLASFMDSRVNCCVSLFLLMSFFLKTHAGKSYCSNEESTVLLTNDNNCSSFTLSMGVL